MKLAASNLAWAPEATDQAYAILRRHGFEGVEAAPGLLFPEAASPLRPDDRAIARARARAADHGLRFAALQAVHFSVPGASLFGEAHERALFLGAIEDAIRLAEGLGAAAVVIGSPRQRRKGALDEAEAVARAVEAFAEAADRCAGLRAAIAVEPVPAVWGADFLLTLEEALDLARRVGRPNLGVNLDLGERIAYGGLEGFAQRLAEAEALARHAHVSGPELAAPMFFPAETAFFVEVLRAADYPGWVSIEMRRAQGDGCEALEAAAELTARLAAKASRVA